MPIALHDTALDQLFRKARSVSRFQDRAIDDDTIAELYDLLKWGPTAFNAQPGRYVVLRSDQAKQRLAPALSSGNRDKTLAAPAVVIVAYDHQFFEHLPQQFPAYDAKPLFVANPGLVEPTVLRNGSLQGAYLILAARALGLDAGPMSGFDAAAVNREFFPDGRYRANFIVNLGYGEPDSTFPRGPRLSFEQAVSVL
ncbi:putative malonic semialdehyde reductase RutE [Janthinobacterium agaricidamnosum NBRC 102515 = DSM 9628]|uniref:Putative NADH dehydrogenase/NAD(P)H nitroreductase GJA_3083 n=1 Tax=Janthinobacterium agaricidamnosum NBRC 102515 = DSM 9628 TaxID=1349767 RepID=W0V4E8_9BURK|nr:putative malonic semialdehyde reductase RutE [Janthinobacterium agaricidamnosum NBRC 102515 = DSM 9628]